MPTPIAHRCFALLCFMVDEVCGLDQSVIVHVADFRWWHVSCVCRYDMSDIFIQCTEPWGTPHSRRVMDDLMLPRRTHWDRPACAATLGSAAYSARHARARPSDTRKERSRSIYTSYTPSDKPDDVALDYICPSHEAVHSASPWSRPQHWYMKRSRATSYK